MFHALYFLNSLKNIVFTIHFTIVCFNIKGLICAICFNANYFQIPSESLQYPNWLLQQMPKMAKVRDESGRRARAEALHGQLNKELTCPECHYCDSQRGTFIKDSAGTADTQGRRYRRFICRRNPGCGKSIGTTEFLRLCNTSTNLRSGNSHEPLLLNTILEYSQYFPKSVILFLAIIVLIADLTI